MIKESNFMIKLVSNHNMVCWMDQSITRGVHQINKLQCTMQQPSAIVGSDSPSSFPEGKNKYSQIATLVTGRAASAVSQNTIDILLSSKIFLNPMKSVVF